MFKSKKGEIIQTKTEKSNKQTDSGKKGKTKSATKRPLLSKFFKNSTKDEIKKNKESDDKEDTLRSENTTEKLDVSEKENIVITTQVENSVSPAHQVENEVVTHEITRTLSESAKDYKRPADSSDKYKTLPRKTASHDEAGKGVSRIRKSSEETRGRKSSAGKKSPKSPGRKNKKGYPEISDAELVFTTANYSSSQESANYSCDSTDDTNSPLFSRKPNGHEISAFKQYSSSISTSNSSDASADSPTLLNPEPLARCDVKSEDMSALIEMLRDLTDSFGAPPAQEPSFKLDASSSCEITAPSTTPNERENEFRLAWQDEAKELSERLLKKIQEIEITGQSNENDNRQQGEEQEEFVTVSNVAEVECSNEIEFANENSEPSSKSTDIKTIKNVTNDSDVSVDVDTKLIENSGASKNPGGVFIFGNKFHSSRHKFEKLEKTVVTETSGKEKHVTRTTITKESRGGDDGHGLPHESTEVRVEERVIQQPIITITSEDDVELDGSAIDNTKQHDEEHIIQEKHVVTISSSHESENVTTEDHPTVVVIESTTHVKEGEEDANAFIEVVHPSTDEALETTVVDPSIVVADIAEDETDEQKKTKDDAGTANELIDDIINSIDQKQFHDCELNLNHDAIKASIHLELESTPPDEPETLLLKEKDGTVVIADVPLKKVETFSQEISENIIRESLNEPQLISSSPASMTTSHNSEHDVGIESPVLETEQNIGEKDEESNTELEQNVTMDDLILKYKTYMQESDSLGITDALGNIKIEIREQTGDIKIDVSSEKNIEKLSEIKGEPVDAESLQEIDENVLMTEDNEIPNEETKIDMKHTDVERAHVDEIHVTETNVSTEKVNGVTETTETITHSHKTRYRINAEDDTVGPERIIDLETMKDLHHVDEKTTKPIPIEIMKEETDVDRSDVGSPRDMFSFQTDYEGVEPDVTVELEQTVCAHPNIEVRLLSEQSDNLSEISEESLQDSSISHDIPATRHLHGDTTVMININKTKDQIIDDDGFDDKDIDIQIQRTCTEEFYTPETVQVDEDDNRPKVNADINSDNKTEIKQLISDIKAENVNIYAPEHSSCAEQCQASSEHDSCETTRRDELIKQLLVKMSKARNMSKDRSGEIKSLTQQKSFDADFIVSLLNSRPGSAAENVRVHESTTNESTLNEIEPEIGPASRVSELAGIILKQYRSQYETIQLEIIDPESPDSCVIVKEVKSYHPEIETKSDTVDEQVIKEEATGEEGTSVAQTDEDDVNVEITLNLPQRDNVDGNIICYQKEEEPIHVNIVAQTDSSLEIRRGSADAVDESEETGEPVVTIIDHVVHESSTEIITNDNEQQIVDENITTSVKAVTEDIDLPEDIISPTDVMEVEVEQRVVFSYEDEEVPVDENVVKTVEKIVDAPNLTEDEASTNGEIEVELEPTLVVCYNNDLESPVIESIGEVIDTESSEPIASTDHHHDVEIQESIVITSDLIPATVDDVVVVTRSEDINTITIDAQETSSRLSEPIPTVGEESPSGVVSDVDVQVLYNVQVDPIVKSVADVEQPDDIQENESAHEENKTEIIEISDFPPIEVRKEEIREIIEITDISEPPTIEVQIEEEKPSVETESRTTIEIRTVRTEQVNVKDSLVPTEVRANLTSSVIIDEEAQSNEVSQEEFDAWGKSDDQACDMITIFKALRGNIASNVPETTTIKNEEPPTISKEVQEESSKGNNVIEESSVTYVIVDNEKVRDLDIPLSKEVSPVKDDLVCEEVLTEIAVSEAESGISFLEETPETEKSATEEESRVEEHILKNVSVNDLPTTEIVDEECDANKEIKNIGKERSSDTDSPKSSTEMLTSQNGNGKLKKRPSASFRKISTETNHSSLTDKIRRSIESDTKPKEETEEKSEMILYEEENMVANVSEKEPSKAIELESADENVQTVISEDDIEALMSDRTINIPPFPESVDKEAKTVITEDDIEMLTSNKIMNDQSFPDDVKNDAKSEEPGNENKENIGDYKEGDEEGEDEKPLYIVCKDVNQTNIITSSRARLREDGEGNSRTSSPSTPMNHSPILRLTSTPPPSSTINITNADNEVPKITTNAISNNATSTVPQHDIQSTTTNVTCDDFEDFKIVTHEKRVMVQAQFFYEQTNIAVQGTTINGTVQRSCHDDQTQTDMGTCNTHTTNKKTVGVSTEDLLAEMPETLQHVEPYGVTVERNGVNEYIGMQRAAISDDIIVPQYTEDRISDRNVRWNDIQTQTSNSGTPTGKHFNAGANNSSRTIHSLDTPVEGKLMCREEMVDLLIDNGQLVEQPDDQMYRERHIQIIPEQTVTLTSREVPKYQNIYIEMRSRGEVPIEADIDPYLSEIHFKDIESKWHNQQLLSPTYTSFQQVIINNGPKPKQNVAQSVVNTTTDEVDTDNPSPEQRTNSSNDTSCRSSPEVTFNKDVHESLQIFCDGLLTGLFKGTEGGDEIAQSDSETTIKINTDLKPIKEMVKEKSSETPSCRVFKCDEVMLRHELQESLQDGKTTTK